MASRTPWTLWVTRFHDHHIPFLERRHQALAYPSQKHLSIHGPLKEPGSTRAPQTDACDQSGGLIVSVRNAAHHSLAFGSACA
jgi:hypothetical protein